MMNDWPDGKRLRGRSRLRWLDDLNAYLKLPGLREDSGRSKVMAVNLV